jgi:hypothetical protein
MHTVLLLTRISAFYYISNSSYNGIYTARAQSKSPERRGHNFSAELQNVKNLLILFVYCIILLQEVHYSAILPLGR